MIFPLIAGDAGREAFFADAASADLKLVDYRALDGRVPLVEYRPTEEDIPRAEPAHSHRLSSHSSDCLVQLRFTYSISALAADGAEIEYLKRSGSWGS